MDLELSVDQADLVSAVREFLSAQRPVSALHAQPSRGEADRRWRETSELGWLGISLSAEHGGVGYGFADETLVFEQIGRYLTPGPFLPTVLAVRLAAAAGAGRLVETFTSASSRVGLAVSSGEIQLGGGSVSGRFLVADGDGAGHLLIWTAAGIAIIATDGETQTPAPSLDETVTLAELELDGAPALVLADVLQARDLRIRANVLSAALLAGIASATCDMSVEFAKTRTQFGKPIGTFQAVSRRCADMAIRAWNASSLIRVAALCVEDGRFDAAYQAAAAKAFAGEAAQSNAAETIQTHGAIGWTAEHDAHFFYKRARLIDTLWGDIRAQQAILVNEHPRSAGLGGEAPPPPIAVRSNSKGEQ